MKPIRWSGIEQLAWNTTSDKIAYTSRSRPERNMRCPPNSDIYVYDPNTKKTANISEGIMGYDTNPQYLPMASSSHGRAWSVTVMSQTRTA
ncbi:MAG: hypothetical protein ACLR6J_03415 [Parabacteroides merdae]